MVTADRQSLTHTNYNSIYQFSRMFEVIKCLQARWLGKQQKLRPEQIHLHCVYSFASRHCDTASAMWLSWINNWTPTDRYGLAWPWQHITAHVLHAVMYAPMMPHQHVRDIHSHLLQHCGMYHAASNVPKWLFTSEWTERKRAIILPQNCTLRQVPTSGIFVITGQ